MDDKKKKIIIGVLVVVVVIVLAWLLFFNKGTKSYNVTFESNGGTTVTDQTVDKNKTATEPEDPTKEGYTFKGWFLDPEGKEPFDFNSKITGDVKLYAVWEKNGDTTDDDNECNLTCEDGYELDSEECKCVVKEDKDDEEEDKPVDSKPKNIAVTSVTLDKTSATLLVGNTLTVKATVKPTNATNKTVTWSSSNSKVVTVDKNGKITAVGVGTATVTAKAGNKTAKVTITVTTQDQINMDKAKSVIVGKTIDKAGVKINFASAGCTIANTANSARDGKTTISNETATKVYRGVSASTVSSTYTITCGSLKDSKTVNHTVPASPYTYTSSTVMGVTVLKVSGGATNYTFQEAGGLKYVASAGGVQYLTHVKGTTYTMVFDSDANTIYAVKSAE